jgi:hypothetical protein
VVVPYQVTFYLRVELILDVVVDVAVVVLLDFVVLVAEEQAVILEMVVLDIAQRLAMKNQALVAVAAQDHLLCNVA